MAREGTCAVPVRLGENGHAIPLRLQHTPDDGGAEAGVIHIGVPGDEEEIVVVPAPFMHFLPGDGQIIVPDHQQAPFSTAMLRVKITLSPAAAPAFKAIFREKAFRPFIVAGIRTTTRFMPRLRKRLTASPIS
jgi:hypothetical protein